MTNKQTIKEFFNITYKEVEDFIRPKSFDLKHSHLSEIDTLDKDLKVVKIPVIEFNERSTWNFRFFDKDMVEYVQADANDFEEHSGEFLYIKASDNIKPVTVYEGGSYHLNESEQTLKYYDFKKCPICGRYERIVRGPHYFIERNDEYYCHECYEKTFGKEKTSE